MLIFDASLKMSLTSSLRSRWHEIEKSEVLMFFQRRRDSGDGQIGQIS